MKIVVALITLVLVAGVAHATDMVEIPNAPYMPAPQESVLQRKEDQAKSMLVLGVVLLGAGLGLEGGAAVYAVDHPCALPLACLFGPPNNDFATFSALVFSGAIGVGGGVTLVAIGGSRLRNLHRPIKLGVTGSGLSLSGRF